MALRQMFAVHTNNIFFGSFSIEICFSIVSKELKSKPKEPQGQLTIKPNFDIFSRYFFKYYDTKTYISKKLRKIL